MGVNICQIVIIWRSPFFEQGPKIFLGLSVLMLHPWTTNICECICVFVSVQQSDVLTSSFLYPTLNPCPPVFLLYIRPPSLIFLALSISLSGMQDPELLSLPACDLTGHILPVPDLQRQNSLGKAPVDWFTDTRDGGGSESSAGPRVASLSHELSLYPKVSGDLVMERSGSEEQCQRTCGKHVEIWEVCCNGIMSMFAAPST